MAQGVDLVEKFNELDADRMMNLIATILIEDAVREAKSEKAQEKARTSILKVYNSPDETDDWQDVEYYAPEVPGEPGRKFNPNVPKYIEPTEFGYPGLEPPVG